MEIRFVLFLTRIAGMAVLLGAAVAGCSLASSARAQGFTSEGAAMSARVAASSGTPANLVNAADRSMCIDADSNHYASNGDNIQLWACNTHPEQEWVITSAGQLKNASTGMCIDADSNHYPSNGDNIQLWACNTHPEQEWKSGSGSSSGSVGSKIVAAAASMKGKHYCWDGGSPSGPTHGDGNADGATDCGSASTTGFDCTGLALYAVYQATHIVLPHGQGIENVKGGTRITSESQLQPGDVILFGGTWTNYDHVGIYAGNGKMWDANISYSPYPDGVQERTLSWETAALKFVGAVRF
jgi:cell wall-associated NlpC family hydrolase